MIWVLVNCYNNEAALEASLVRFRERTDLQGVEWRGIVFDTQYPLTTREKIRQVALDKGFAYMDLGENLGQSGNFNLIRDAIAFVVKDEDVCAFWDCDNAPDKPEWLKKCVWLHDHKTLAGFTTPCRDPVWVLGNQGAQLAETEVQAREITFAGGWPMGCYRGDFFLSCVLPRTNPFYGSTELDILNELNRHALKGYMLCDVKDEMSSDFVDPEYVRWKAEEIGKEGQLSFPEWLEKNGLGKSEEIAAAFLARRGVDH